MIVLENITYRYRGGGRVALRNLNLRVNRGEAVCVMGRNGSGKSTLARLVAGLIKPDQGRVMVNGDDTGLDDNGPRVGILFQNTDNQMVATLVDSELAFALENKAVGQEEMEAAVTAVAARFGISHLLRRLTSDLSGGEKQRVALASIMIQDLPVLVLDEPDSFLDEAGRRILSAELTRIHVHNPDLVELRITQDPEIARDYPRLVVIDEGEVCADGPPEKLLADESLVRQTGLDYSVVWKHDAKTPEPLHLYGQKSTVTVAAIRLDTVSFAYPMAAPLLEAGNLTVKAGETVGLVGPTGAGKSSLGLLLCGLLKPTGGAVVCLDSAGNVIPSSGLRGRVAALLQQPERQFFLDTCAEEIAFGPANLGRHLSPEEIGGFFEMVGLSPSEFASRDPFSLSGGEKRRLAFAAVLSMSPSVVVFDEPTAGLDPEGVGRFLVISRTLRQHGVAQVIISHDGNVIGLLADRVVYLQSPSVLRELSPQQLLTQPEYAGVVSAPNGHPR